MLMTVSKITFSQEVSGTIMHKNKFVAFSTVYVKGTSNGTFANSKGEFKLVVNSLQDTLVILSNGFKEKLISAKLLLSNPIVYLEHSNQQLDIITVSNKKTLAKTIIKNVIKNRNQNDYHNESFSANLYTKSTLDRKKTSGRSSIDTIQLSFSEKYSKIEYSKGKWKETKLGLKDFSIQEKPKSLYTKKWGSFKTQRLMDVKSKSNLFYNDISDGNFNFYRTTILVPKLGQNPFISPLGTLALTSYNYSYIESYRENNHLIHKIKVTPKRPEESVFKGVIQVEDSSWAIVSTELEMNGKRLHKYKSFKIYQRFSRSNNRRVLDRQEFFYYYNSNTQLTPHHGTVYSKFSNYAFSDAKIKLSNLTQLVVDSAYIRSETFWEKKRSIQLSDEEKKFIETSLAISRLKTSEKYIKRQDSLKNRTNFWEVTFTGIDHYNTLNGLKWKINPLIEQARIFGIGGYRHALGGQLLKTFKNKNDFFIKTTINYGFNNKDLLSDVNIKYTYAPKKFAQLKLSGGRKYQMLTYMQNLSSLFSRGNFIKNDFLKVGHFCEILNGLFLDIDLNFFKRSSISNLSLSNWSKELFSNNNEPLEFENYQEFNLKAQINFTPNQKFGMDGRKKIIYGSKWPTFLFGWEHGIPNLFNSKINYQKITCGFDYSYKLSLLGTSKIKAGYGQYLSIREVELPNYSFFRGTDNYFFSHPLYTFQLLGETYRSLENYASLNFIHHFHGAIIKKLPGLKKTKLESVAGGGILYINDNNLKHSEVYYGVETPFKMGDTQLKFGCYYTIAYSNYSNLLNMFKFGLNVFNPFTNKWAF